MADRQAVLAGYPDPGALLGLLHGDAGTAAEKNAVLRVLVSEAQSDAQHSVAGNILVILALWPGLGAARNRLMRFFRNDPDVLTAELTGRLSQGIASIRLDQVNRIAATLLRNVERDIKRQLIRQTEETRDRAIEDSAAIAEWPALPGREVFSTLRQHVGSDAELVMAVAVFGFSQKEAARALGLSYDVARKRYQRAMASLVVKANLVEL